MPDRDLPIPRAVLFDMDGVLIDSYDAWFSLVNAVADRLGYDAVSPAAFTAGWGQGIEADVETWFPRHGVPELEAAYAEGFEDHVDQVAVDPDAARVVRSLREAGLGVAVITNTPSGIAAPILTFAGIEPDALLGGTDVPSSKPAPDMVLEACRRLAVSPADAWVVGDSAFDAQAARAAGCAFVGYRRPGDARVEELVEILGLGGKRG